MRGGVRVINDDLSGRNERDTKQRLVAGQERWGERKARGSRCVSVYTCVPFGDRTEVDCVGSFERRCAAGSSQPRLGIYSNLGGLFVKVVMSMLVWTGRQTDGQTRAEVDGGWPRI